MGEGPTYRAAAPSSLRIVRLDVLDAVYHRPSGATHLLASPAIEILTALAEPGDAAALRERLSATFDLAGDPAALDARLAELVAIGLVSEA